MSQFLNIVSCGSLSDFMSTHHANDREMIKCEWLVWPKIYVDENKPE